MEVATQIIHERIIYLECYHFTLFSVSSIEG